MNKKDIYRFHRRSFIASIFFITFLTALCVPPAYLLLTAPNPISAGGLFLLLFICFWIGMAFVVIMGVMNRKRVIAQIESGEIPVEDELNTFSFVHGNLNLKTKLLLHSQLIGSKFYLLVFANDKKIFQKQIGRFSRYGFQLTEKENTIELPDTGRLLIKVFFPHNYFSRRGINFYDNIRAEIYLNEQKKGEIKYWSFPEPLPPRSTPDKTDLKTLP